MKAHFACYLIHAFASIDSALQSFVRLLLIRMNARFLTLLSFNYRELQELTPAALMAMKAEDMRPLIEQDFVNAVQAIRPSVSPDSLQKYSEWAEQFGVVR